MCFCACLNLIYFSNFISTVASSFLLLEQSGTCLFPWLCCEVPLESSVNRTSKLCLSVSEITAMILCFALPQVVLTLLTQDLYGVHDRTFPDA